MYPIYKKDRLKGLDSSRIEEGCIVVDARSLGKKRSNIDMSDNEETTENVEQTPEPQSEEVIQEEPVQEENPPQEQVSEPAQEEDAAPKEEKSKKKSKRKGKQKQEFKPGVGLDIGTSFLVSSRLNNDDNLVFRSYRDAFYTIKPVSALNTRFIEKGLKERGMDYHYDGDMFTIIGQGALTLAQERGEIPLRPLHRGVLSAKSKESLPILKKIISTIIGSPVVDGETCVYSVPANPVDTEDINVVYHEKIINKFLEDEGYTPYALNEGEAISYSALMDEGLTGMTASFGAGMVNFCLISAGDPLIKFSISKSGDFIDSQVAKALDITSALAQAEKESPDIDLMSPNNKIAEAIAIYYQDLIAYVLEQVEYDLNKLSDSGKLPSFSQSVVFVVSGGTSKPKGFMELLRKCLDNVNLPIKIKEVRQVDDPLTCVARGNFIYGSELGDV